MKTGGRKSDEAAVGSLVLLGQRWHEGRRKPNYTDVCDLTRICGQRWRSDESEDKEKANRILL